MAPQTKAEIRADIQRQFADLFGIKQVNGREIDVERQIYLLAKELHPQIAKALAERSKTLGRADAVRVKYGWPGWEETFEDPVSGRRWTFREIAQGMIDNFLDRQSAHRWRLNDEVAIPPDADPLKNPGLELTGPWFPLDMAIKALNSDAPMNMPDFEDASPAHFRPTGASPNQPVGVFAALANAKGIFAGQWNDRAYEVVKKGRTRSYTIDSPPDRWPIRFARPPGLHVRFDHVTVDGEPVHAVIPVALLWAVNNYDSLTKAGTGVYYYIPKIQTPAEALIVEKLLGRIEEAIGLATGALKIKVLYEEGNGGRYLPIIAWTLRRRLLGTNVGRWDYLGSLIEMWKDDPRGVFPDPQTIGMASPNMIAYQRYNSLVMLMAGMKSRRLTQGAPIGGMAAVMIYQPSDPFGRARYNPLALRAMIIDKLRERLLGLYFVPESPLSPTSRPTLDEILSGRAKGRLYDAYRQSWVASPEPSYVAAGNAPLQAPVEKLQAMIDAPPQATEVKGKAVPTVASGLIENERALFESRELIDAKGKITPQVLSPDLLDSPEKLFTQERWESIYAVPKGEITIEHIQHAFYMAANYGFQILNGNFAAAIDDYELLLRFMNDLATYRIDVSWLWTLIHHRAEITRDGSIKAPALTDDGVVPAVESVAVKAGTPFDEELFGKVWAHHSLWTEAFFADLDRRGDPGRFDRSKAPVIMELLRRQLLSANYIQHSARVLFIIAEADEKKRDLLLDAIFSSSREEVAARVREGSLDHSVLTAYDYVYDVFLSAG